MSTSFPGTARLLLAVPLEEKPNCTNIWIQQSNCNSETKRNFEGNAYVVYGKLKIKIFIWYNNGKKLSDTFTHSKTLQCMLNWLKGVPEKLGKTSFSTKPTNSLSKLVYYITLIRKG